MEKDSRTKMIESAAALIGRGGVNAASFSLVLEASGAPRGSIYHHFPEGKSQLAAEAVRHVSKRVLAFQGAYDGKTAQGVLDRFIGMWRKVVRDSKGRSGCVVAGVAIDSVDSEDMLLALVRATFREWIDLLAAQFEAAELGAERARAMAVVTVAGMEGSLILCRAEASTAPLDIVAAQLSRLLAE
jgi:AcrR family transcriptional regulator